MGNENYNLLMEDIGVKNELERLIIVNNRIDEIISKVPDKRYVLESLICTFEAKCNVGAYFSALAISYAVFIGAVAILPEGLIRIFAALLLLATCFVLAGLTIRIGRRNNHRSFVLCALRIRYEKMKGVSSSMTDNKFEYKEDEEYKEYVVRVMGR